MEFEWVIQYEPMAMAMAKLHFDRLALFFMPSHSFYLKFIHWLHKHTYTYQ